MCLFFVLRGPTRRIAEVETKNESRILKPRRAHVCRLAPGISLELMSLARLVLRRRDELGRNADEPDRLTRAFHSAAMARVNKLVGSWMSGAGLEVRQDAAFNIIGRWPAARAEAKTFLLGSHLDTVRDAGKYDGPLGVLVALAAVENLRRRKVALPFHLEVIGFSDEEGLRYQISY